MGYALNFEESTSIVLSFPRNLCSKFVRLSGTSQNEADYLSPVIRLTLYRVLGPVNPAFVLTTRSITGQSENCPVLASNQLTSLHQEPIIIIGNGYSHFVMTIVI